MQIILQGVGGFLQKSAIRWEKRRKKLCSPVRRIVRIFLRAVTRLAVSGKFFSAVRQISAVRSMRRAKSRTTDLHKA